MRRDIPASTVAHGRGDRRVGQHAERRRVDESDRCHGAGREPGPGPRDALPRRSGRHPGGPGCRDPAHHERPALGRRGQTTTYLDTKQGSDRLADLYVPVLLAFSIFALFAAAFTIVNVVSGIVLTGYRQIGVMKAVGFTPAQVASTLVGQVLVPVAIGVVAGVIVGSVASQPIVRQTAMSFGLPAEFTFSPPVVFAVVGIVLGITLLAAIGPAIRAGAASPATAITRGTVPSRRPDGGRLRRAGLGLPMPVPVRLGVAAGLAQPLRAAMTLGALVVGVAAVTFALGLNASLLRVKDDLDRNVASPARVELMGDPGRAADVTASLNANPDTAWLVSIGEAPVAAPGLGTVPFVGYDGQSQRLGYAVIRGRWSTAPGEAVAPTNVFTQAGLAIGDRITLTHDGKTVTVRLVGEIFDVAQENPDDLVIRGSWTDLAALQPGVSPEPLGGRAPRRRRTSFLCQRASGSTRANGRRLPRRRHVI